MGRHQGRVGPTCRRLTRNNPGLSIAPCRSNRRGALARPTKAYTYVNNTPPRLSLRNAIDDKCRECIYCPEEKGAWRQQVAACTVRRCPLFPVRPVPRDLMVNGTVDEAKADELRERLSARDA